LKPKKNSAPNGPNDDLIIIFQVGLPFMRGLLSTPDSSTLTLMVI
jgi:hypothetical protein